MKIDIFFYPKVISCIGTENDYALTGCTEDSNIKHYLIKVHVFWEGHKILRNLHLTFVLLPVKSNVKISQNFVDFSEYMNYNYQKARQIRSSNCIFRNLYYVCTDTYECSTWSYSLCMHSQYYNHLKICSVSFTRTKSSERKLSGVCCYFCGCPSTQCTKWEISYCHFFVFYARFRNKCSNWRRISKLSLNFECLLFIYFLVFCLGKLNQN